MKLIPLKDCLVHLERKGRTVLTEEGLLFCDWTCSGIRFSFTGTSLSLKAKSIPAVENGETYVPWIGVVLDDADELTSRVELLHEEGIYPLYISESVETHTITLVKLTENAKGKMGIRAFLMDGAISSPPKIEYAMRVEFIGDSITCGFGNMVNDPNRAFYSQEENGWMSHAAIAARLLNADASLISCSGITVTKGIGNFAWNLPPMPVCYPCQDYFLDKTQGKASETVYDFSSFRPHVVVLNLGTNDAALISLNREEDRGIRQFCKEYRNFLAMIRRLNGPEPFIVCALGPLDYYLYDCIRETVEHFVSDTQDTRIRCFKYHRVRPEEGMGACGHPTIATQVRMGQDLAAFIRELC